MHVKGVFNINYRVFLHPGGCSMGNVLQAMQVSSTFFFNLQFNSFYFFLNSFFFVITDTGHCGEAIAVFW